MIDKISVMAADIDGTLIEKGGDLKPHTLHSIQRLHEEGVLFGVASGRPIDERTHKRSQDWNLGFDFDFMIGMNGGDLWTKETQKVEHFYLLSTDVMKDIMSWMKDFDMNAISFINGYDEIWATRMDEFLKDSIKRNKSNVKIVSIDQFCSVPTGKIEIHYNEEKEAEINALIEQHKCDAWTAVKTFTGTVEFQDPRLNKGHALVQYMQGMNLPLSESIAFGDMDNDFGLIKEAGWGVCLKNGCEACKEVADAITDYPVEEDGVGRYLEDHWFQK